MVASAAMAQARRRCSRAAELSAVLVLLTLAPPTAAQEDGAEASSRPNVVYLLVDDLGYGDVGYLNPDSVIQTPHIDRLATEGMSFTDAHSGSSVCSPTRYGILTGRYAWRSSLQKGVARGTGPLLSKDRLTVATLFSQQGYHTEGLGKWHLGLSYEWPFGEKDPAAVSLRTKRTHLPVGTRIRNGPANHGFDSFYWFKSYDAGWSMLQDDLVVSEIEHELLLPELTTRAVDFLKERAEISEDGGPPFFLYWAPVAPHAPFTPTEEWRGSSGLGDYGDFVMQLDWSIGEILAALADTGLADDTLLLFASDNGPTLTADLDALLALGHDSNERYRGAKKDIWEGGHRIPFTVRWPGRVEPGVTNEQLISLTDFMATVAEVLQVDLPPSAAEDSVSMVAALTADSDGPLRKSMVVHSLTGKFAIREGDWKLALCAGSGGLSLPTDDQATQAGAPAVQLFNLADDPSETTNLQGEHPQIVARLTALLKTFVDAGRSTEGPAQSNDVRVDYKKR